jgi:beta-N-acetylhexosaminidase
LSINPEVRRLALSCLLLGFVGPTPPPWLLSALADGMGGVVLFGSNLGDGTDVATLTAQLRAAAGRPIALAVDEEGGDVTRLDTQRGSASPGAAALGYLDDVHTTEEVYAAIGGRLVDAGITMNLAPVADVNVDPLNPVIGLRSFSADAARASDHVAAAVRGLQRTGIVACLKHFPGHGATRTDSHHALAVLDRDLTQLESVEFAPFRAGIAAGARSVMTGHLLVPALDPTEMATISRPITTGVLREQLGFEGTIFTDAIEMRALAGTVGMVEGFVQALIAGADAIETGSQDYPELVEAIPLAVQAALQDGRLSEERLMDAAERTARLAVLGAPAAARGFDRQAVAQAAARCLEVDGVLPPLRRPLVIECRTPGGIASGELPWSLAKPLAELVPDSESIEVTGPIDSAELLRRAEDRSLVVLVRDPDRVPWQQQLLELASRHPNSVVVDAGWPTELRAPDEARLDLPVVRTRGIAPGLLSAAAELLATRSAAATPETDCQAMHTRGANTA